MKKNSNWKTFNRFWPMISPFKISLVIAMMSMMLNASSDAYMISLLKPLLDEGFGNADKEVFLWIPITIIILMIVRGVTEFISVYCIAWASGKVVMNMRRKLFKHIMHMPISFFDEQSTGKLLSCIIYDSEQIASSSSNALIILIREGISIIGMFVTMFYCSWRLSLILIVISPMIFFIIHLVSKKFRRISKRIQNIMGQITTSAEQMLKGHKEVLLFGGQKIENERFLNISNQMRQNNMKMITTSSVYDPIIQFISSLALSFVLYIASFPKMMQTLTPGTITVVFSLMIALMKPLKSLTNVNTQFQKGMVACRTLFTILDMKTEKDEGKIEVDRVKGDIVFKNVTFSYPNQITPSLFKINLSISAGRTIALVGKSGSGKSTIVNLLTRFYDIQRGRILLDGYDLCSYKLSSLRNQVAIVSQNIHLFNDTIANNISYPQKSIYLRKQVENAANMAYITDFIEKMEMGLDTIIGENGILLSVGQRQRIAIARAFLKDSPILILDEATSSLDSESERIIQKSLIKTLKKNRTALIIAHRLSSIEKVDEIFVIENGRIIERGNHKELISYQGVYAQLYQLQFNQQNHISSLV